MCQNHIPEQAQNVTNHVDNNLIKFCHKLDILINLIKMKLFHANNSYNFRMKNISLNVKKSLKDILNTYLKEITHQTKYQISC